MLDKLASQIIEGSSKDLETKNRSFKPIGQVSSVVIDSCGTELGRLCGLLLLSLLFEFKFGRTILL